MKLTPKTAGTFLKVVGAQTFAPQLLKGIKSFISLNQPDVILKINAVASASSLIELFLPHLQCLSGSLNSFLGSFIYSSIIPVHINQLIEKISWTYFLQSALCLSVWNNQIVNTPEPYLSIVPMIISFLFGSLGTIIGGYLAYHILHSNLCYGLNPSMVAICTSSLTASYTGGTANFYEVVSLLKDNTSQMSLFSTVAGADIGIMCFFFKILYDIRSYDFLKHLFSKSLLHSSSATKSFLQSNDNSSILVNTPSDPSSNFNGKIFRKHLFIFDMMKYSLLSIFVVFIANNIKVFLPFAGSSVMGTTILAILCTKLPFFTTRRKYKDNLSPLHCT